MEDKLNLLARVLSDNQLTRISYEEGDVRITLEKDLPQVIQAQPSHYAPAPVSAPPQAETTAPALPVLDDTEEVKAPLAGIYYGKPAPEARHFVREGQKVKAGEVLCIIESMKIMNEIKAQHDMTIVKILKHDEEVAEYNEPLFKVTR